MNEDEFVLILFGCQVTATVRSRANYGFHNQGFTMKESIHREAGSEGMNEQLTQMVMASNKLYRSLVIYWVTLIGSKV